MPKPVVSVGDRFGRLLVVEKVASSACRKARYRCQCDCGRHVVVQGGNLRSGRTRSCRCWADELSRTHGGCRDPEYRIWHYMIQRCESSKASGYVRYGGSGITVCRRWRGSYARFLADVGRRPSPHHTLERRSNTRGYTPSNVRWATRREQANNRRTNRRITLNGVTHTIAEWSRIKHIPYKRCYYMMTHLKKR